MTIPQLISERRKALNLSLGDVGRACGYSGKGARSMVQRWELGKAFPPPDRIRRLAAVLRLPIDALIP